LPPSWACPACSADAADREPPAASDVAGSEAAGTGTAAPRGTLNLGVMTTPNSWDVDGFEESHRTPFFTAVFDTLLRRDGEGNAAPGIATAWEYDESRTALTLTLREGVEFTDGTPLDAEAVVANIENFRASSSANVAMAERVTGAEALDAHTVVIHLSEPDPQLLTNLALPLGYLSSPASWDNPDVASNPVGSGGA